MSESAFEPVFVVQFGGRSSRKCTRSNYNRRKNKSRLCNNWHNNLYDSLLQVHMALSSSCTLLLLILLLILCSIDGGGGEDVSKGREISSSGSYPNSNTDFPTFDVNDLKNLIEIFPEFREYVFQVVASQVEKQKQVLQEQLQLQQMATTERAIAPLSTTSGYNVYDGGTSQNSRKDVFSWTNQQKKQEAAGSTSKHSYGWPHSDDYHPHYPSHSHYDHDHHKKPYGYGYTPSPSHSYGWSSNHHDDTYKDPKFHYEVGYQLGKDVSCVLGLLGFKSIKDFSIHSIFSFLKKLKYVVLIGLAFKLGVVLSPIALPLLFPVILMAVIAKILPLILIICLLFKLLKTQLKLGIGREVSSSVGGIMWQKSLELLEDTNISRFWSTMDAVTQRVSESELCVEKIVCKMVQKWDGSDSSNSTYHVFGSSRRRRVSGLLRNIFSGRGFVSSILMNITNWIFPRYRSLDEDSSLGKIWECDKIPCNLWTWTTESREAK